MNRISALTLCFALLLAAGCGNTSGNDVSSTASTADSPKSDAQPEVGAAGKLAYIGTWESDDRHNSVEFSQDGTFKLIQDKAGMGEMSATGTYTMLGDSKLLIGGTDVKFKLEHLTIKASDPSRQAQMDRVKGQATEQFAQMIANSAVKVDSLTEIEFQSEGEPTSTKFTKKK